MKLSKKLNNLDHAEELVVAIFKIVNPFSNCLNHLTKRSILVTYHTYIVENVLFFFFSFFSFPPIFDPPKMDD